MNIVIYILGLKGCQNFEDILGTHNGIDNDRLMRHHVLLLVLLMFDVERKQDEYRFRTHQQVDTVYSLHHV